MAIEIITQPDKEPLNLRPTYTRKCPECGCEFTYKYKDCIESNWRGGYVVVLCPICKYPIAHIVAGGGNDINHPVGTDV